MPLLSTSLETKPLLLDGDRLHLEMAAAEEWTRSHKCARRKILGEVVAIDAVELVVECEVRAEHLDIHEVLHGHPGLCQSVFDPIEQQMDFLLEVLRRLAGLGIDANPTGQIKGVPHEHAIAERRLKGRAGRLIARRFTGPGRVAQFPLTRTPASHTADRAKKTNRFRIVIILLRVLFWVFEERFVGSLRARKIVFRFPAIGDINTFAPCPVIAVGMDEGFECHQGASGQRGSSSFSSR